MERTQHIATGITGLKGNEILAMIQQTKEGTVVAIRPLCTALKLDWMSQYRKVTTNDRFNYSHITMVGADGKQRGMVCLPAEQVPVMVFEPAQQAIKCTPEKPRLSTNVLNMRLGI